jgi:hypothetical protein
MTPFDIIRGAIPDANEDVCEFVLFNRSPFPFAYDPCALYKSVDRRNGETRLKSVRMVTVKL